MGLVMEQGRKVEDMARLAPQLSYWPVGHFSNSGVFNNSKEG